MVHFPNSDRWEQVSSPHFGWFTVRGGIIPLSDMFSASIDEQAITPHAFWHFPLQFTSGTSAYISGIESVILVLGLGYVSRV